MTQSQPNKINELVEIADSPKNPPGNWLGALRFIGPGMIVAGSIVGSGELLAITKTGADLGFSLLWLIIVGCAVKVFIQVELARFSISTGRTTLDAFTAVPGPKIEGGGNWLLWYWFAMWLTSIVMLGGLIGSVGEVLATSVPVTRMGQEFSAKENASVVAQLAQSPASNSNTPAQAEAGPAADELAKQAQDLEQAYSAKYSVTVDRIVRIRKPADVAIWACFAAAVTSVVLTRGRFRLIQALSVALVVLCSLLVVNFGLLQGQADWRVGWSDIMTGLSFQIPEVGQDAQPTRTMLAVLGIIGLGTAELIFYPYWCLERGYARFVGKHDGTDDWLQRAKGWMRVLRIDAWLSMLIYTALTVLCYFFGAAMLRRANLSPDLDGIVRTQSMMFEMLFSEWAATSFLIAAFAVVYSTYVVINASHARVFTDALIVMGIIDDNYEVRNRWIKRLSGFFPMLCVIIFLAFPSPGQLVLLSGVAQGTMLPMLAGAALYFRYKQTAVGLRPGSWWDAFLWLGAGAMLIIGCWTIYEGLAN